jgi:hypothetical protein
MASVDTWWTRLSPSAKRNLAVGSIGTVLLAVIIALATVTPEVSKPLSKQATIQHILTDSDPRSLGIDGISAQLRDLLQKNEEQARRLAAIEEQQKREQQSDEIRFKQWTTTERDAYEAKLQAVTGEVETLKNKAILPNRFHADVRECFLLAAGFGDLSAERAYFRGETFSCVRQDGGVIEVPMNAYATGEDGKNGVRGRVVSKQGALLAQSMMAGFLRGFSDAFGRNQIPMLMTGGLGALSGTTPFQSAFSSQSMEGGALKGAGYAMERLSHFYMDMAEEIYPVIEVDATRQVNFIVQKGTALKLKSPS